ncbi:MAG: Protein TolB [Anaerolineales bacterium]|nr:Protein TolB [Anaerolineales bacterium]
MLKYFIKSILILSLCMGLSTCSQPNGTPITLSTKTPTLIPAPTKTPSPTLSPTATVTPYPTLSTQKPYLLTWQSEQVFLEYDAEGLGRKVIELPPDGYSPFFPQLKNLVSPDGKWLVFYTGNVGRGDTQEILPVTLNILNISNGEVTKIADVVTEDYKEKLGQLAEELKRLYPDYYKQLDNQDWVFGSVLSAFTWSIHSVSWSPDGHRLAFAAQIDGISSDVYLFNLDMNTVEQIESSIQNIGGINWSPDGQYIVFVNSEPGYVYTGSSLYAVQPNDRVIDNPKKLYGGTWLHIGNWLSPNLILVADGTDTAGIFNLQSLDIRTGKLRTLWTDSVSDYAIDPSNKIIALNTGEFAEPEKFGVYFITYNGQQTKVLEGLYWATLFFRGGEQHRFLMQGVSEKGTNPTLSLAGDIVGLNKQGGPTPIAGKFDYDKISISPDKTWLLMYDDKNLYLYDVDDNLTRTFPTNGVYSVIWRPDSQAIFFSDGKAVYFLSIPNGNIRLIDECEQYGCSLRDITWLP